MIINLRFVYCLTVVLTLSLSCLQGMTIAEKKATISRDSNDLSPEAQNTLHKVNEERLIKEKELYDLYAQTRELHNLNAPESHYQDLLSKVQALRNAITQLDQQWRQLVAHSDNNEEYALWQQPDTTLEQLIMDYGSHDYVYLIPPAVAGIKLSIASNLPIPRASWTEMLDLILTKNGVGVRQLNTYLRELYLLPVTQSGISLITNKKTDLGLLPADTRIAFLLSPEVTDVRRIWFFLNKFTDHQSISLQQIGRDILIVATVSEINDLLKLYDFVAANRDEKEHKLISLTRADPEEMATILSNIFDQEACDIPTTVEGEGGLASCEQLKSNSLQIMVLNDTTRALFLIGTREEISKAERIICEVEEQLCTARDKVVFWYTVKHSEAEEMASVLAKVYALMVSENTGQANGDSRGPNTTDITIAPGPVPPPPYHEPYYQEGSVAINPAPATLLPEETVIVDENRRNFIVDAKTGSIVMVVKAEFLPKIKELIRKLDVPKKMVQIEVLLVEKKLTNTTNYGLNLLKIGSAASNTNQSSFLFNDHPGHGGHHGGPGGHGGNDIKGTIAKGLTEFIISGSCGGCLPAFDMIYNFLISQEEIQINACPSVTTINQTPAKIVVVEETSINTGIVEVPTTGQVALKDSFTRAQYGITLEITPTIHLREESFCYYDDDTPDYITLETNVNFDTIQPNHHAPNRPNVTRRNIQNEVMIPDGQTVILGGLRRKNTHDGKESIPFLGEIPGIGKLFSETQMHDSSTEMFIFITPKIIYDPVEDLERIKLEELSKRPGDIPEFLYLVEDARQKEKEQLLSSTLRILFGRDPPELYPTVCGEYDGR